MKKSNRLFLLVACVSVFVTQAQTKRWTLEECIALALEKNVTIKQNELDYASAELDRLVFPDSQGVPGLNGLVT